MPLLSGLRGRRDDKMKKGAKDKAAAAAVVEAPLPLPDEFAPPTREVVRPTNQLALTEAELKEEIAKMLTANNPAAPQNLARFNMKERSYKFEPMVEQHVTHYASDGWLLHKSSEEARKQLEQEKTEAEAAAKFQAEMDRALKEKAAGLDVELPDDSRQLRNQFNFSERAAQTFSYPLRDRATFTEPAPKATISGTCSMRDIFDEYCRDFERQRQEETSKQRPGAKKVASSTSHIAAADAIAAVGRGSDAGSSSSSRPDQGSDEQQWAALECLLDRMRIVDRMVNQNTYADVAMDFKYWDDTSDALRPGEGSLLPLWQFVCEQGRKHVTSMCWSSLYADQFAVGYGSFHYQRQGTGAISVFSLKNPSHAEVTLTTESGVMALQFHPDYANLLAVGCHDGSVAVYDVRQKTNKPLYTASPKAKKHSDTVWQVCWQVDEMQKGLAFVSISTDGDVLLWTLAKCELLPERLMRLQPPAQQASHKAAAPAAPTAAAAGGAASGAVAAADELLPQQQADGGLCMDFGKCPGREHVYLVGSESGQVYQCSTAYGSDYLGTFGGHCMPVYAVKWNSMHPDMFLSCSADWNVKVWDNAQQQAPLLSFDVGAAVGDVAWAPYSSTVFAAVTDEGKVHVFDLSQNRQLPMCVQKCVKKARLTRIAFNLRFPILLVGDSKGNVSALKLSPNLRKCAKDEKTGVKLEDAERQKLEQVIAVAKRSQAPVLAAEKSS